MKRYLFVILLCAACSGLYANADTADVASPLMLSLDSCRAMALRTSEDIKIAELTVDKAQAEKNALTSMYFPKVSAMGGVMYVFKDINVMNSIEGVIPPLEITDERIPEILLDPINKGLGQLRNDIIDAWEPMNISLKGVYMAGLTLMQPVFAGGRVVTGNRLAKMGVGMAQDNLQMKKNETLLEADKMYWMYVSVREKVKLASIYDNLLTEVERLLTNVEDVDMINRNDLMKVQVQHNQVRMQLQQARSGAELCRMALCRMIGLDYAVQIVPTDTVVQTPEYVPLASDSAVYDRLEYRLMKKMIMMKEGQVRLTVGEYLPTVGLAATYSVIGGVEILNTPDLPYEIPAVMATVNIPLTQWWEGSQKIKSAKIDKNISMLEMEKNKRLMELEIKQATLNMQDAFTQIKMSEEALDQAKENLRISTDRYQVELETIVNLLDAQSQWQMAYSDLIDARINFRIRETEFLKATAQLECQ